MSDQEYGEDYENEEQHNEEENEDKNENLEQSNKNESQANNNEDENNEQQQNDNDGDDENQDNNEQDQQQDDQQNEEENQDNEGEKEEDQQEEKMEKLQQQQEEQEQEVEESQFEQSMQSEKNVNLESIDAVSVKISKEEKGTQKKGTKKATKTSSQQEMVNQLMKKHKEKQQKMQKREDEIYIQEKIEKKQPKPQIKPKVITKQKLTFDKQTKAQLEDPQLNNQQKAAILTKDLGKKLDVQVVVKEVPKKMEVKKPGKGSEAKPKKNLFDVRIGAGIKSKLDVEADDKSQRDKEKERNAFLEQKKREKEQAIKFQQEQDELLKIKQNNIRKAQEKALERDNKVLQVNTEKQQEIKQVYEAKRKELIKEKEEDNKDQIKKDLDILRALRKENTLLNDEVKTQEMKIKELDKLIEQESRKENVIQINGEYQSLRKIRLKQGLDDLKTELVSGAQSQILGQGNISDPDIALTVANQIAKNDLKLNDAYALLDEDKDGVLTIKEIQNNICRLNLNIKEQEIQEFIKMLDNNSDGVLTEQEFITFLTPGLENQKQYIQIMGDIKDILNPIILEERRLHLKYLQKYLQKEIEDENKKEREQKPKYDRLIKKLKKTEKLVESLKGTTSDKGKVKQQCDLLRQELRSIQDKRNKVIAELDDKKLMIKENIDQLMKDLGDRCQEVLQMKEKLNQVQTQSQRLQLKLLSIEQMKNKYKKELKVKNEIEIQGGQKQNVLQQLRLKEEKIQQQEDVKNLQYMHYVIIVQKCTRGFLMKKRLTKKLSGLKGCAKALVTFIEKKHRHQKMQGINLLEEFVKQQKKIEIARKEQELLRQQEQQKKKLKDKKANKVERFIAQQFVSTKVEDKLNNIDQTLSIIPKIILIQKIFRKNKRGIPLTNQAINVSFGIGYSENCQICKTDLAEVICKQCEKPIQCDSCFRLSHKNYKRRNHEFYLLIKNKFRDANEQLENRNIEKQNEMDEVLSNQ
ncbi:unnamed protein product [Paramecium primaurelia]|uniref:EF-hand domain-containing protein n=1 Tax=Paramecium primaurelia TaxID=5886 RepID=A0A8S1MF01_PARPR|nr:unnamed protein product [Paramecium primaurelia]